MATEKKKKGEESKQPERRESAPPSMDEREDEGWDQPESSAQKSPAEEPEDLGEGR